MRTKIKKWPAKSKMSIEKMKMEEQPLLSRLERKKIERSEEKNHRYVGIQQKCSI